MKQLHSDSLIAIGLRLQQLGQEIVVGTHTVEDGGSVEWLRDAMLTTIGYAHTLDRIYKEAEIAALYAKEDQPL